MRPRGCIDLRRASKSLHAGDVVAQKLVGIHLDFDMVSLAIVSKGRASRPALTEAQLLAELKDLRYNSLMDALRSHLSTGDRQLVVSAPFTREMTDPSRWGLWTCLCPSPTLFWLFWDESERQRRVALRAAARDVGFVWTPPPSPEVCHCPLDSSSEWPVVLNRALDRLEDGCHLVLDANLSKAPLA